MTGNRPRHAAAASLLRRAGHDVAVIVDTSGTTPPIPEGSHARSAYFKRVAATEREMYGEGWGPADADDRIEIALARADFGSAAATQVRRATADAEGIVLYGCSYLSAGLLDTLERRRAISVHMGIAPFYRGAAANFWAAYDGHPWLIGGTAHFLVAKPDAGPVLFYSRPPLPDAAGFDYFRHSMASVRYAMTELGEVLGTISVAEAVPPPLPEWQTLRNSAADDFTDAIAKGFMSRVEPLFKNDFRNLSLRDAKGLLSNIRSGR